jgi:hypothetical protein
MQLEGIKYIPGGPLPVDDPAAPGRSESYYELVNHGEDVHADSLVALNAGISCQLSKQRNFKNGDRIAVKLFGDNGVYFLYCSDKFNQVYRYKLSKRKIDMGDLVHFVLSVDRADF